MSDTHDYEGMKIRNLVKLADDELDGNAMCELGFRYCAGYDIRPNQRKGFTWLLGAAMLDVPIAQYLVGTMFIYGKGTPVDYDEAMYWFTLAAENGHVPSLNELGIMFADGMGVEADLEAAKKYWTEAANAGNEDAAKNLELLAEMEKN